MIYAKFKIKIYVYSVTNVFSLISNIVPTICSMTMKINRWVQMHLPFKKLKEWCSLFYIL